uniref:Astacin domain-containing protein n=1 Tax=Globodera pallida TaxID=36090 RepID=A0A183CFM7_GLOPA
MSVTAAHELLHALGLLHEQSRSDARNFTILKLQDKQSETYDTNNFKFGYDFGSVMHYGADYIPPDNYNIITLPRFYQQTIGQNSCKGHEMRCKNRGSPQKLPGENGLHTRDGSLTKRKQEQWERERAEGEQTSGWFNKFGQKHTPGRRRAVNWAINEGAEAAEAEQAADADNDKRRNESDGATTVKNTEGEQTSGWFNKFGQKHTPGRRRAVNWAINEGAEAAEAEQAAADADNGKRRNESDGATTSSDQQLLIDNNNGTIHHQMQQWKSIEPSPMAHAPSPLVHHRPPSSIPPAAMLYSAPTGGFSVPTPMHFFTTPPPPLFGDYHHQAQCQRQFLPGAMPMFPQFVPPPPLPPVGVIDTAAFILAAHQQQKFPLGMPQHPLMPTPPFSCPSSLEEAGNNSPAVEQHQQYHQHQLQLNETVPSTVLSSSPACIEADNNKATPPTAPKRGEAEPANFMRAPRRSLSMDASGTWEEELARQVAERQMSADREAHRALEEERVREREERECRAREEAEREAEERRRTDRIEARDQNERSTFASLQRAQREAELLRRAKLFRHILLDGDGQTDMDTARRLLKCADGEETVLNDVIRQLRDFDRQKRLANESCGNLSPSSTNGKITPKSAKDAGKAIGKTALFSRANSWNVKHSRTMPAAVFSPPIIAQSKLPPLSVAEHAKVRAEIVVTAPDIVHQKNVALPPKKTASANGQNTVSTTASPSSHNNSTVTSPNTSSKYGNGSQKPTPPDKQHKSLRQKVQNAVRSGAAMLRRKDSGGKTNGDGAKVLRTVGLFEQVTLRHRTSSNSNSNNQQQQQQQQNRHPSSPSLSPSPTSAASTNSNTPPNQPAQQHPVEEQPLFSSPTFEFLLPPPLPVLADHRRRGRQLFELGSMTLSTMALPEAANDVKQMKLKHQQQQHVEEKKFDENGVEDDSEGKVAKCQNAQENGGGKAQQNSPPGSSATSSSSASVLRFRAALDSPFGSREDISNSLIVSNGYAAIPPAPPKFVGGPLRYANGGVSVAAAHQLVPPSPFRRPAQNGGGGDSSEPLLRRSLRSPTMRRLQESLQSLAEDAPMSPTVSARGDVSRADTPKPFNCRTSQYRSLNLKRDTERQKQILEHLAQVRIQLKNSQVQIEQTISKQNLTTEGH